MDSGERQPLLGQSHDAPQPTLSIPHLAQTLAAVRAGKLPDSQQLATLLESCLHSPLLQIENTIFSTHYGSGRIGTGALTREGEQVRKALRDVFRAVLQLVREKDPDDRMQEFLFSCKKAEIHLKTPSKTVPPPSADEIEHAKASLHTLILLFFTSPQLRSLIRDTIYLARDVFDSVAAGKGEVGEVATAVVDKAAEFLAPEDLVSEDGEAKTEGEGLPTHDSRPASPKPAKSAEDLRDEFVDRFKEVLRLIQENPAYQSAVRTLLLLLKTYLREIITSASISVKIETPQSSPSPMSLLIPVLEPFTGGPGSLSPLRAKLESLAQYTRDENRISTLLSDLDDYISHSLLETGYLSSAAAHRRASRLHDDLRALANDNPSFRRDVSAFIGEVHKVLETIASDQALTNLLGALEAFVVAGEGWAKCAAMVAVGQQGVWGDVVEIEFKSDDLDLAIDAPPFLSTSFIPDSIRFDTNTSLHISPFTPSHPNSFTSTSTLSLEGLRMSTDDVGYYVKYKEFCLPFIESGLLDLHFGTSKSGGIGASVDFSTATTPNHDRKTLFDVHNSAITIESFDVRPHQSSHPILMWFLRPILTRIVRKQLESVLEEQVRGLLELSSRVGWEIRERSKGSGWRGIFSATVDVVVNGYEDEEEKPDETNDAVQAAIEEAAAEEQASTLHVSGKGITIDLEAGQVGVGAEGLVLPLGDAATPIPRPTVVEIVQEHSKEAVGEGARAADALLDGVEQLGQAVGDFGEEVAEERENVGWRSDAFSWST
ncbi:hypothetical protein RQP46_007165 [Phenoliferia psychrophenolica]